MRFGLVNGTDFVEVLRQGIGEQSGARLKLPSKDDDVTDNGLGHPFGVDCCFCSLITFNVSMLSRAMSRTSSGCLVHLEVGVNAVGLL